MRVGDAIDKGFAAYRVSFPEESSAISVGMRLLRMTINRCT